MAYRYNRNSTAGALDGRGLVAVIKRQVPLAGQLGHELAWGQGWGWVTLPNGVWSGREYRYNSNSTAGAMDGRGLVAVIKRQVPLAGQLGHELAWGQGWGWVTLPNGVWSGREYRYNRNSTAGAMDGRGLVAVIKRQVPLAGQLGHELAWGQGWGWVTLPNGVWSGREYRYNRNSTASAMDGRGLVAVIKRQVPLAGQLGHELAWGQGWGWVTLPNGVWSGREYRYNRNSTAGVMDGRGLVAVIKRQVPLACQLGHELAWGQGWGWVTLPNGVWSGREYRYNRNSTAGAMDGRGLVAVIKRQVPLAGQLGHELAWGQGWGWVTLPNGVWSGREYRYNRNSTAGAMDGRGLVAVIKRQVPLAGQLWHELTWGQGWGWVTLPNGVWSGREYRYNRNSTGGAMDGRGLVAVIKRQVPLAGQLGHELAWGQGWGWVTLPNGVWSGREYRYNRNSTAGVMDGRGLVAVIKRQVPLACQLGHELAWGQGWGWVTLPNGVWSGREYRYNRNSTAGAMDGRGLVAVIKRQVPLAGQLRHELAWGQGWGWVTLPNGVWSGREYRYNRNSTAGAMDGRGLVAVIKRQVPLAGQLGHELAWAQGWGWVTLPNGVWSGREYRYNHNSTAGAMDGRGLVAVIKRQVPLACQLGHELAWGQGWGWVTLPNGVWSGREYRYNRNSTAGAMDGRGLVAVIKRQVPLAGQLGHELAWGQGWGWVTLPNGVWSGRLTWSQEGDDFALHAMPIMHHTNVSQACSMLDGVTAYEASAYEQALAEYDDTATGTSDDWDFGVDCGDFMM